MEKWDEGKLNNWLFFIFLSFFQIRCKNLKHHQVWQKKPCSNHLAWNFKKSASILVKFSYIYKAYFLPIAIFSELSNGELIFSSCFIFISCLIIFLYRDCWLDSSSSSLSVWIKKKIIQIGIIFDLALNLKYIFKNGNHKKLRPIF